MPRRSRNGIARIEMTLPRLMQLAQGGTAVGTGLNAPAGFAEQVAARDRRDHRPALRLGAEQVRGAGGARRAWSFAHGALEHAGRGLFKIANDIRLLGSGPRSGLGELSLPENEPGSSIMPGKVNPTQVRGADHGLRAQVFGNKATISLRRRARATSSSTSIKPVIAYNLLQSIRLLADAAPQLHRALRRRHRGRRATTSTTLLDRSLMLVTALAPKIGYDAAAKIAKAAHKNGTTLREEAVGGGYVTEAEFDAIVRPEKMLAPEA